MKAVMYGAGNIGRGFIGQIFAQSGYEVIFIDVADAVVSALNREGRYPIRILANDSTEDIWVEGVSAIDGRNVAAAAQAIAEADIMATAVGVGVLPRIAPVIAAGFKLRYARRCGPLDIIICENLLNADTILAGFIQEHLTGEEQAFFNKTAGLVEASIGRMVPLQTVEMQDGNPLRVCAEAYGLLPVARAAFKGKIPALAGLCPSDNFDFYIQRKLFIHNMGHGICAYLGMIRGCTYIYEAAGHPDIQLIARNAMRESARALSAKYRESFDDLDSHISDLLLRFSNRALGDTCARVGSDTTRKLGRADRFIGALRLCAEQGVRPAFISVGVAAALYCHLNEKGIPQSRDAARAALRELSGLEGEGNEKILLLYAMILSCRDGDFDGGIRGIIGAVTG